MSTASFTMESVSGLAREEKEFLVTYQIAFVGTDGVLLGSGCKVWRRNPASPMNPAFIQFGKQDSKFIENDQVVCACSGSQESRAIALNGVLKLNPNLRPYEWEGELEKIAKIPGMKESAQLLIARTTFPTSIIHLVAGENGYVAPVDDRICAGANSSACFLTDHFWVKSNIRSLVDLALLTLEYGREEFSSTVGEGFELKYITSLGIETDCYEPGHPRITQLRDALTAGMSSTLGRNRP